MGAEVVQDVLGGFDPVELVIAVDKGGAASQHQPGFAEDDIAIHQHGVFGPVDAGGQIVFDSASALLDNDIAIDADEILRELRETRFRAKQRF